MIDKLSPNECMLCGSCADACPANAISFKKEHLAFHYPEIDPEACISCGLCDRACPVLSAEGAVQETRSLPRAFAAGNPDPEIRRNSSSGGIFRALAQAVLDRGGYVCGAVFDEDFRVAHRISDREEDVRRMMGSKYAQSDLTGIYREIRELLRSGKTVLFTGCPCQAAALRSFLGKDHENLFAVDFICHGTPSGSILRTYLDDQEKQHQSRVKTLCFRDKKHGWHRSSVRIGFENGAEYCEPITVDAYMKGFLGGIYLKESCYDCKFKNFRSGSDLTMGDFWGVEAERPDLDDNTGLSAILVGTEKGGRLLEESGVQLHDIPLDTVIKYNRNLVASTKMAPDREEFYEYAKQNGLSAAIRTKLTEPPMQKLRRKCRYALRCVWYFVTRRGKPLY